MQPLTAPPRDGLTADEVTYLLRDAPSVEYRRGLELFDMRFRFLADVSEFLLSGSVSRNTQAAVHGTCDLVVAADAPISYSDNLLRPYLTLSDGAGLTARFNLGMYVPQVPQQNFGDDPASIPVTGSDLVSLLNRPIGDSYSSYGDYYVNAAVNVLLTAGFFGTQIVIDTTSYWVPMAGTRTWPMLTDPDDTGALPVDAVADSSNATTFLRVANELLAAVNYRGVYMDWDGRLRLEPYADPMVHPSEFTFDVDDAIRAIIGRQRSRQRDIAATPNRWVFVQSNLVDGGGAPVMPTEGAGRYTVQNFDDGDTSITARGGWPIGARTAVIELDAADQATLVELGDKRVAADRQVSEIFTLPSSPFPAAWHEDVYTYVDAAVSAGPMKVMSTGWTLDLGDSTAPPQDMQHTLVRVA